MIEDKLSREERIRLEALNQAVNVGRLNSDEQIVERAERFERYIRGSINQYGGSSQIADSPQI